MSCCGRTGNPTAPRIASMAPPQAQARPSTYAAGVTFEYLGSTSLTAVGGVTGRHYLFARKGARVAVDRRDFLSLLQVPVLQHVQ